MSPKVEGVALERLAGARPLTVCNVLVLGGTADERERAAHALHAAGSCPVGPFVPIDCHAARAKLREVIRVWIVAGDRAHDRLAPDERGTLLLESVESLTRESQHLLLIFLDRLADSNVKGRMHPIVQVIAASQIDLEQAAATGAFLPELFDALNKLRIDLDASSTESPR